MRGESLPRTKVDHFRRNERERLLVLARAKAEKGGEESKKGYKKRRQP